MRAAGFTRRELMTALGLGLAVRPAAMAAGDRNPGAPAADLPGAGPMARRALEALRRGPAAFEPQGASVECDLGSAGTLAVERLGEGGVQVVLTTRDGELEILRSIESPVVGSVVVRPAEAVADRPMPPFDTMRRVPAGVELTFSSELALLHATACTVVAEMPRVYEELADLTVAAAAHLLA